MHCSGSNKINIYVGTTLKQSSSQGVAIMTVLTSSMLAKIFMLTVCFLKEQVSCLSVSRTGSLAFCTQMQMTNIHNLFAPPVVSE